MTLKEAALLAREVLSPETTLADAVYNADVHSLSLFNYSELNNELEQLYHEYSREADKLQSVDKYLRRHSPIYLIKSIYKSKRHKRK